MNQQIAGSFGRARASFDFLDRRCLGDAYPVDGPTLSFLRRSVAEWEKAKLRDVPEVACRVPIDWNEIRVIHHWLLNEIKFNRIVVAVVPRRGAEVCVRWSEWRCGIALENVWVLIPVRERTRSPLPDPNETFFGCTVVLHTNAEMVFVDFTVDN